MQYNQAVILTDLDGTLFNSNGDVSTKDRAAIREFIAGGGYFGVGTDREPHNARRHLPGVPLNGPSIVLNGAAIYDFVHRHYLNCIPIDMAATTDVLLYCQKENLPLDQQIYTTDGIYYATPLETADPGFLRIHQPTICLPVDQLAEKTWIKVVMLEREVDALAPMRAYLKEKGYDKRLSLVEGTTDVVKIGKYQELLPQDVTKGTGVTTLRKDGTLVYRTPSNEVAYVAAEADVQARLLEQVVDERGGSGLAVASGDADLLRAVVPCRELDFGDDVYAFLLRFPDHGRGARDARTLDDFVGIEYQLLAVLSLLVGYLPLLEHADVAVGYLPLVGEEHVESLDLCQDSGANSAFRST